MAAYCQVYDSRKLQADCQEPGSAPEPHARESSTGYIFAKYRTVYETVEHLSVCPSVPSFGRCVGLLLWARWPGDTNCCMAGA